ncbi:MAG: thiol reductase thioredoxin, partial [Lachnospiraceae bacterium]|nr:thiol reductase thioredoxin [Lachnospiraceae bacterium]
MQPIVITADNFEEKVINSPKKIMVDFWASWCGPCKALSPIVEEIAENADDSYLVG